MCSTCLLASWAASSYPLFQASIMVQPLENLRRYGARDYGSVWVNVFMMD